MARAMFAPTLDVIRLYGAAYCLAQLVVTTVLPVILWYQVYRLDPRIQYLAYITWLAPGAVAVIGVAGHASAHSLLLALHAVLAITVGASLGAVHTSAYMQLNDRCAVAQVSFAGCSNCTCAIFGRCTKELMSADPTCGSCQATGADVCQVANDVGLLTFMGLACLLAIALPALPSLQAFCRVEVETSSISNRLQYARNVVSRELVTLEDEQCITIGPELLEELTSTLLAYGQASDKAMALKCVRLARIDLGAMATTIAIDKLHPDGEPGEAARHISMSLAKEISQRMLSVSSNRGRVAPDIVEPNRPPCSRTTSERVPRGAGHSPLAVAPPAPLRHSPSASSMLMQAPYSPARSVLSVGSVSLQQRLPDSGADIPTWGTAGERRSPLHWACESPNRPRAQSVVVAPASAQLPDTDDRGKSHPQVSIPTREYPLLQPTLSPTSSRSTAASRNVSATGALIAEERLGASPLGSPSGRFAAAAAAAVAAHGNDCGHCDDTSDGGHMSRGSVGAQKSRSLRAKGSKKTLFVHIEEAAGPPCAEDVRMAGHRSKDLQGPPGQLPGPTFTTPGSDAGAPGMFRGATGAERASNGAGLQAGAGKRRFDPTMTM